MYVWVVCFYNLFLQYGEGGLHISLYLFVYLLVYMHTTCMSSLCLYLVYLCFSSVFYVGVWVLYFCLYTISWTYLHSLHLLLLHFLVPLDHLYYYNSIFLTFSRLFFALFPVASSSLSVLPFFRKLLRLDVQKDNEGLESWNVVCSCPSFYMECL